MMASMRAGAILAGMLGMGGVLSPQGEGAGTGGRRPGVGMLYLFITPEAGGAPEAARRAVEFVKKHPREVRLRPVLLVDDFNSVVRADPEGPLYKSIRELGRAGPVDIPLYDEEGLRLAERWKIKEVPAFVLVRPGGGGRAHRVYGDGADLEGVFSCSR